MTDKYIQDPGHGGTDPGACAKGNIEKNYTLEAATYVNKRLATHGITSDMTRTSDITLDETPRVNKVKSSGAKQCLSHHFNAGGGEGMELIHSIYSDGKFEKLIADEFKNAGFPLRPRTIFTRKGSNGQDYYYMHRRTGAVSTTIIEYEFVDGDNAEKIKSKSYREGMYECVVRAICKQENVTHKPLISIKKSQLNVDKIPEKSSNTYRLAKFVDTQSLELINNLKKEGYQILEVPSE